jgi:hypothetical protein
METQSGTEMVKPERRYDIDWLRIYATLGIFVFHCSRFFDTWNWHVKNNQLYPGVTVFVDFMVLWIMPTFFFLSGISSYYSLSYRTGGQYIRARVTRLLVPFIFGVLTLIPPQVYFERVSNSQFTGSFIEFYPHYFDGFYAFGGNFAWMGLHLWYLEFLFLYSLMTLPLFLYLRREKARSLISWMASIFSKPGGVFLFAIPLIIMNLLVGLQPDGIGRRDMGGWSIAVYPIFFIYGYLITCDSKFSKAIERHRLAALIIGASIAALLPTSRYNSSFGGLLGSLFGNALVEILGGILRPFASWCWLVVILGFGSRYLNFSRPFLQRGNEAGLPFYILHQTVILTIGFGIANWRANLAIKYLVLSIPSFAVIVILYELLIRRINLLRFLFGMKLKRK